jgi:8-hydroxy-5-deazaflavin:NADPH oxidoreductase
MTTIGLIGGTGDLGTALAVHLSKQNEMLLGSRSMDKAKTAVEEILKDKDHDYLKQNLKPAENSTVVASCGILILTVPHGNTLETISGLASKFRGDQILISATASVSRNEDEFTVDPNDGEKSIAVRIREILPGSVRVAAAFQTVPANILYREKEISADVPVAAESREVYEKVASIVSQIAGLRPLYLGSLRQAGEVERMTSFLLNIGKRNGLKSPTIKFLSF